MVPERTLDILGGGLAGLAVAYFAEKNGLPFTIYESGSRCGGMAVTFGYGDFLFDSGAHRLHDLDSEVTDELKNLLGSDLRQVTAPSMIFDNGRFTEFPFVPSSLVRSLGIRRSIQALLEVAAARLRRNRPPSTFYRFAAVTYGETIARKYLLNYTEKLWGVPAAELLPRVAGNRMISLDFRSVIRGLFMGRAAHTSGVEGTFYYPRLGIGMIPARLAAAFGPGALECNAEITRLGHSGGRIREIEINGQRRIPTRRVISTVPLPYLLRILDPPPPPAITRLTRALRYRSLVLVALLVNRQSITNAATIYFPARDFPFARVSEPRNRSPNMSPALKTSLVAELPCFAADPVWSQSDEGVIDAVIQALVGTELIQKNEVFDATVARISHAYPVLELGTEHNVKQTLRYLESFDNLVLSGRNATFQYCWMHDVIGFGKRIVEDLAASCPGMVGERS